MQILKLLSYFYVIVLWLLMLQRLLSSLLEPSNTFADVRGGQSGIMNANKVDITYCCYEAETSLGKQWYKLWASPFPWVLEQGVIQQWQNGRIILPFITITECFEEKTIKTRMDIPYFAPENWNANTVQGIRTKSSDFAPFCHSPPPYFIFKNRLSLWDASEPGNA